MELIPKLQNSFTLLGEVSSIRREKYLPGEQLMLRFCKKNTFEIPRRAKIFSAHSIILDGSILAASLNEKSYK